MREFGLRVVLCLAGVAISLVGLEIVLALSWPVWYRAPTAENFSQDGYRGYLHRSSDIPGLDYELAPNMNLDTRLGHMVTNSFGMRDAEPLPTDLPGLIRFITIGDSLTFGYGVASEETYSNVLEGLLRASPLVNGQPVEVLNMGVSGYSSADEALAVEHKVLDWDPDLIIIGYVQNDPEIDPVQPLHNYFAEDELWRHFHTTRLIAMAVRNWNETWIGDGDYIKYLHAPDQRKWKSVEKAFDKIGQLVSERSIPVIVLIFPVVPKEQWGIYEHQYMHDQITEVALKSKLDVLDIYEVFRPYDPRDLKVSEDDGHPSPLGHRIVAEAILSKLISDYADIFKSER